MIKECQIERQEKVDRGKIRGKMFDEETPLGIMPLYRHQELRATELALAISRYTTNGKAIDDVVVWADELQNLCYELNQRYNKKNL